MKKIFSSPGKFIINAGELSNLAYYVKLYGQKAILVAHDEDAARVADELNAVRENDIELIESHFGGECTEAEIARIRAIADENKADIVVGLGGGKALDTSKCVAYLENKRPLIVVPTIASTDAPCSTLAAVYNEQHVLTNYHFFPKNPDIVLVDSQIIAQAPPHFLMAGIGDAYATYFEARVCMAHASSNFVGGVSTQAAFAAAELCHDILVEDAAKAMEACRQKVVTKALENVIEANLLLSGLGFESVGTAAAHSLHDAITTLTETHRVSHGEKVAIGLLAQHVLENEPKEQVRATIELYKAVGLPTKLADIGITEDVDNKLRSVAKASLNEYSSMWNMPAIDENAIFAALKMVDTLEDWAMGN